MLRPQLLNIIGLQTPGGRVIFFLVISTVIYFLPYQVLANLSLWKFLNIPSPSIGLTRAYWLVLHGDLSRAANLNRLIFVILVIGIPLLARDLYQISRKR